VEEEAEQSDEIRAKNENLGV